MQEDKESVLGNIDVNMPDEKRTSGGNQSYWIASTKPLSYSPLKNNIDTDVAIIGGGIAGITCAYMLSKQGRDVVLIEDGYIGSGETGRTTAHFTNALDNRYYELESFFAKEGAKLAAESHTEAINLVETIVNEENIDCGCRRLNGYLFLHKNDKPDNLNKEFEAAKNAGLNVTPVNEIPGISLPTGKYLKFPEQLTLHPMKYIEGLCNAIQKSGGKIFTNTRAEKIESSGVYTKGNHKINAKNIIVATNTPFNNMFVMHTKQAPYRTYVIAGRVPKNSLPDCLWWDTGDHESEWPTYPYHYIRIHPVDDEYDLLISGGEDHKSGQPDKENIEEEERYTALTAWTKKHFPMLEEIEYRWSGQVQEPYDGLNYIGKNPMDDDNIYIVTGDSGNGMTGGSLAGIIIPDLINGLTDKFTELYDPKRKTIKAASTFIEEQVNVAKQFAEYLTKGDIDSINELKADEGAIIRNGSTKAAVYKDISGKMHAFSAVCPHLKCILEWNGDEKSFDCPCHGSRFSCFGKLLNGPANKDLTEIGLPE